MRAASEIGLLESADALDGPQLSLETGTEFPGQGHDSEGVCVSSPPHTPLAPGSLGNLSPPSPLAALSALGGVRRIVMFLGQELSFLGECWLLLEALCRRSERVLRALVQAGRERNEGPRLAGGHGCLGREVALSVPGLDALCREGSVGGSVGGLVEDLRRQRRAATAQRDQRPDRRAQTAAPRQHVAGLTSRVHLMVVLLLAKDRAQRISHENRTRNTDYGSGF